MVTWDHPPAPDRNGAITNYTVTRQTGSKIITMEPASNDTSLLLTGLMPFTVYNIVAGSTSAGRGEFTTPVTMRTRIDSEWVYNEDNPTFLSNTPSIFTPATITKVGQTYTIPAGSASLRVGYYGPRVGPTLTGTPIPPTPENTVIVGSFGKYTTTDSVAPQVKTLSGTRRSLNKRWL